MYPRATAAMLLLAGGLGPPVVAPAATPDSPEELEPPRSYSRSPYVHRLTLYDHDGVAIDPGDAPARPYSPHATCGKCHAVANIRRGWHFDSNKPNVDPGRPGEPWILTDPRTGTQLPLSTRGWPGTYTPADAGLSNWDFVRTFGRHLPGGGLGDPGQETIDGSPKSPRWGISGRLEIDCMFCHAADGHHDPAEAARQIEKENFQWAATAALGLAVIRGEARNVPDNSDPFAPPDPDFPERSLPTVVFDPARFDADDRVLFNITRRPSISRCYFCHTVRQVGSGSPRRWETGPDVHLAAGMICTDCHRNDIGHMITRGYEDEAERRGDPSAMRLSCRGCHLGVAGAADRSAALGGQYGAPQPLHRGMPPVHFEKLTCTACHAGPWPEHEPRRIQTSMAHRLGLASKERRDDDPPLIVEPIFALRLDGKVGPHRMVWPAFWGRMEGDTITPLRLPVVRRAADLVWPKPPDEAAPRPPVTSEQIAQMLAELGRQGLPDGEPVYVRSGYVHRRTPAGGVETTEHPAAAPYLWPLGHDVRPAAQSLGIWGCTDCHARDAPFYFGRIGAADDLAPKPPIEFMHEFQDADAALVRALASSFAFRPVLRGGGLVCAVLLGAVLVLYSFYTLGRLLRRFR